MANILSTLSDQIEDLRSEMELTLELQRGDGCNIDEIRALGDRFANAVRPFLTPEHYGGAALVSAFPAVEGAYVAWKGVRVALQQTLDMAYSNDIPRSNLLLDDVHAELVEEVGEPLAICYTELHRKWRSHLSSRPWDAFQNGKPPEHSDDERLERVLGALARGDELDVEDALGHLTGDLRQAFAELIAANPSLLDDLEINLWRRPEILIAGDYWGRRKQTRLLSVLREHASERLGWAIETLEKMFTPTGPGSASVIEALGKVPEQQRSRFFRCLMLHPDYEVRRYAAGNVDNNSMWKVLTPRDVPCATILTLLERLWGSNTSTIMQQKIFFDTIYRRLLTLGTRSDVLYARGIVRILTKMNFFLEDGYFTRLMTLLDYLEAKEKAHGIVDGLMPEYIRRLKDMKQKAGSIVSEEPTFEGVPLVVLRKLARDGHFWLTLSMHPIVKIARETVRHINCSERAIRVASNHRANQEVLRAIGKRRDLFATAGARDALLTNPRTPVQVSLDYLSELTSRDIDSLLRRSTIHPELRATLRNRLVASR